MSNGADWQNGEPTSPAGDPDGAFASDAVSPDTFTETTHVSLGEKLMESVVGVGIGLLLVVAMGVLLFWNEGRAVQTERSLDEGGAMVVKADAGRVDAANEGRLVHVRGDLQASAPLADEAIGIRTRAARLVRHVEMYQWKEDRRTETRKNVGGSEERITTYSYTRVWDEKRIDSSRFHRPEGHQNPQMRFSEFQTDAKDATLGAFRPGPAAIARLSASEPKPVPADAGPQFRGRSDLGPAEVVDGALYLGPNPSDPRIGDLRITYKIAPLGPTSFIGRQAASGLETYQTKAGDALLLARSGLVEPEAMFAQAQAENRVLTWILRFVGFLLMFVGFALILRPIAVLGDIVPVIGSILGVGTSLAAFALTLVVAPLVIAIAWLVVRPFLSVAVVAIAAALVFGIRHIAARRRESRGGAFAPGTAAAPAR